MWIPSLNVVVSTRGNWGSFVPGDPSSGVNQRLKLLTEAAGQANLTLTSAAEFDGALISADRATGH